MGSFDPVFYDEEVHILTSTTATQLPIVQSDAFILPN